MQKYERFSGKNAEKDIKMGSGKRKYKNRPRKFTLGSYKEEVHKVKASKEEVDALIDMWQKNKKNGNKT